MSLPLTQQQTPWCHLTRYAGVTSVPTVVLPQTWRWHYLRCYLKYGGRLTSGATADTEVASPQVSVQIWRQRYLRQRFTSAPPGPVSPGQTGTNRLHPPGSLQPPRDAGSALVPYGLPGRPAAQTPFGGTGGPQPRVPTDPGG